MLILVGDMCQLPIVCRHIISSKVCLHYCISSSPFFSNIEIHNLTIVLRQASDKMFLNFLNDLRYKDPTQADIDSCLGSCYVTEEEALAFIDRDTTVICLHRDKVAYYNILSLMSYFLTDEVETVEIKSNVLDDHNLEKWKESYKIHQLTHVAIGCKVLLIDNIKGFKII
jgi:hypothetical protein